MNESNLEATKAIVAQAFEEDRAFPIRIDPTIVSSLRSGAQVDTYLVEFAGIRDAGFSEIASDSTVADRLRTDARLALRLTGATALLHLVAADNPESGLEDRRYVIIQPPRKKSRTGIQPDLIIHSGLGPKWVEIPSIYLDMRLFDLLGEKPGVYRNPIIEELILVEERGIELGFTYLAADTERKQAAMAKAVEEIAAASKAAAKPRKTAPKPGVPIEEVYARLEARIADDELNYDQAKVLEGIELLEAAAKEAKDSGNGARLEEIVAKLVPASGHDLHEARNRANIALERIFSPKEYDAPLATEFHNLVAGETRNFRFTLPVFDDGYELILYIPDASAQYTTATNLRTKTIALAGGTPGTDAAKDETIYETILEFDTPGFVDYIVKPAGGSDVLESAYHSGRIHILPDINGEIVLQIFPDIHGHTKTYWKKGDGHPGLVYNEAGEVIRLGNFDDIAAHLEDLKERYLITGIYLLGVQTRGTNREDWSPSASSPSPFSPVSLTEIEPSLGGEDGFRRLVDRAHELDIRVIVDIIPHLNRRSETLPEAYSVRCYDESGNLVIRASTDGRYGSWNDGKLLNYRRFEIWKWFVESITTLVEKFDIDGIRIDTGHALPVMMKRNNYLYTHGTPRNLDEMVHGDIVVNDREDDHFITTGYYDSACRDRIACPFYTFLNRYLQPTIHRKSDGYFTILAESYWGRERFLTRSGVIAYNSALFKICENITHGKSDVREIYHLYDQYYVHALPAGAVLIGIFGNHDERRALNTFGERGVRAAIGLTAFLSSTILDYEGSAEGESWKVYMDNIYVNWNHFDYASNRSLERFYREIYALHRETTAPGRLLWTENHRAAAAIKPKNGELWIGAFGFSEATEHVTLHFDAPELPIVDDALYRLLDPVYSAVTGKHGYYEGVELKASLVHTMIPYTDRVKFLVLEQRPESEKALADVFRDSFSRIRYLRAGREFAANLAFRRLVADGSSPEDFARTVEERIIPECGDDCTEIAAGLNRVLYHGFAHEGSDTRSAWELIRRLSGSDKPQVRKIGELLEAENAKGPFVFVAAEADPFSKAGGLANVTYELPRELAENGEEVYVITPKYRHGTPEAVNKMAAALDTYDAQYTGKNVGFFIESGYYEVGVHRAVVGNVTYFLLDHYEFFDGLYWGYTAEERLRRRIAIARASAEVMLNFDIAPLFIFTNDAYTGLLHGILRSDRYYAQNPAFERTACFHIIHNGGWQYFDAYDRYQNGKDLLSLLNLPLDEAYRYCDPVYQDRINCMAAAIRFADKCMTVSPTYAEQLGVAGDGLERIIDHVVGINNALAKDFVQRAEERFRTSGIVESHLDDVIGTIRGNRDLTSIVEALYPELLSDKPLEAVEEDRREIVMRLRNKLVVQAAYGLDIDPDAPLVTMIHRVADQKGFQLLLESSEGLCRHLGVQIIAGGPVTWDDEQSRELAQGLEQLGNYYPGRVAVRLGFHDVRIPLLASDAFLMPSRHEPGGISQLEALACGCPVIARVTGGLRDTVSQFEVIDGEVSGTGVLFTDYNAGAFYDAVRRFVELWKGLSDTDRLQARNNARKSVYYWDRSADRYVREAYGFREIIHT